MSLPSRAATTAPLTLLQANVRPTAKPFELARALIKKPMIGASACRRLAIIEIFVGAILIRHGEPLTNLPQAFKATLDSYGVHTWIPILLMIAGFSKLYAIQVDKRPRARFATSVIGVVIISWFAVVNMLIGCKFLLLFNGVPWVLWIGLAWSAWDNVLEILGIVRAEKRTLEKNAH